MCSARGRLGLLPQKGKGEQNFEEERATNVVQVWGYFIPGVPHCTIITLLPFGYHILSYSSQYPMGTAPAK